MMLATLRRQWGALRRLDHFRREGVSNLSHDLRSPLTATAACLETLEGALGGERRRAPTTAGWSRSRCATPATPRAWCSRSATWPSWTSPNSSCTRRWSTWASCSTTSRMRFAERAAELGVDAATADRRCGRRRPMRRLDIELFERAIANLVDNALKFCPRGARDRARRGRPPSGGSRSASRDNGPGIAAADLPHLFDRFYQSRQSVAPATGEGGKGLGPGDRQAHRRAARRRGRGRQRARPGTRVVHPACRRRPLSRRAGRAAPGKSLVQSRSGSPYSGPRSGHLDGASQDEVGRQSTCRGTHRAGRVGRCTKELTGRRAKRRPFRWRARCRRGLGHLRRSVDMPRRGTRAETAPRLTRSYKRARMPSPTSPSGRYINRCICSTSTSRPSPRCWSSCRCCWPRTTSTSTRSAR